MAQPLDTVEIVDSAHISGVLDRSRELVAPALRAAIDRTPAPARVAAGYHLGWCDRTGRPTNGYGGKSLRSALALLAAEAVGGNAEAAVPAAVAVELVHNSSLLHDDVIDGDATRRHRPTVWAAFGTGTAIFGGDSLLALALEVLAAEPTGGPRAVRMLHTAVQDLLAGQFADTEAEKRTGVDLSEALRIADTKTGALMAAACGLGALAGGGSNTQIDHLARFGRLIGVAFQVVDDLLGIWGDSAVTGKPLYSDLLRRKKSTPVAAALASGTAAGRELAALYERTSLTEAELPHAASLVAEAGGRDWCRDHVATLVAEAHDELNRAGCPDRPAAELRALAAHVARRDH